MPADRFYIDTELKGRVVLEGPEHHHLAHVMRVAPGEEVELVNGRGGLGLGKVVEVDKKRAAIQILSASHQQESLPRMLLAVPLMRPAKLEWVVEKGTELGASAFLLYRAAYSEIGELYPRILERLRLVTIAALKQSGRLYLPSLEILSGMEHLFHREAAVYFGDLQSTAPLAPSSSPTLFISGPEKGFSPEELVLLRARAKGVRLSAYTLRAETAPIAAASILGASIL